MEQSVYEIVRDVVPSFASLLPVTPAKDGFGV